MNKKLQVFVSSTYSDLIEERRTIIQTILDAGHIPAGMELFKAGTESQLKTICRWIDESDIYILILGGRYGFIESKSGKSCTQLEYEYALLKNKAIFSIVLEDSFLLRKSISSNGNIIFEKENIELYRKFKSQVSSSNIKNVKNIKEIQDTVQSILIGYTTSRGSIDIRSMHSQSIYYLLDSFYKRNPDTYNYLRDNPNILKSLCYYHDIINHYKFENNEITHEYASTNKCIIDPLGNPISDISNIQIDVSEVNDWMLNELNKNPTDLYKLSPRKFEEVIAEILSRKGYDVTLTAATRDGGKDIYAARKDDIGSFLYVVECKKYNPNHKVGVKVLRDLYGVISKENLTAGIIATTSFFTKPAKDFQQDIKCKLALNDYDSISKWLYEVTHNLL